MISCIAVPILKQLIESRTKRYESGAANAINRFDCLHPHIYWSYRLPSLESVDQEQPWEGRHNSSKSDETCVQKTIHPSRVTTIDVGATPREFSVQSRVVSPRLGVRYRFHPQLWTSPKLWWSAQTPSGRRTAVGRHSLYVDFPIVTVSDVYLRLLCSAPPVCGASR